MIGRKSSRTVSGRELTIKLEAGGGQLVELVGDNLGSLCATAAIYEGAAVKETPPEPVTDEELRHIRAARLRIDIFGSNGGARYKAKFIELNGHRLCEVPANNADAWTVAVIELTPEQIQWVKRVNRIVVRTQSPDMWKFRNLTLAVQLSDGRWVKTNRDPAVYSTPGWAYSEGKSFGKDGVAGPIELVFAAP